MIGPADKSRASIMDKRTTGVLGHHMAYVEEGSGNPIVLLHGNPTSSFLWRSVIPHLAPLGCCIAPDLIGMGDSEKLEGSGPGSYRFVERRRYLDAFVDAVLPASIQRQFTDAEMAEYRRPFARPGEDRRPTLTWPREIPVDGEPADVVEIVERCGAWPATSYHVRKLFVNADPGTILTGRQASSVAAGRTRPRSRSLASTSSRRTPVTRSVLVSPRGWIRRPVREESADEQTGRGLRCQRNVVGPHPDGTAFYGGRRARSPRSALLGALYAPHPSALSMRRISAASSSAVSSLICRPRST